MPRVLAALCTAVVVLLAGTAVPAGPLAAGSLAAGPAHADAPAPLRILVAGDSLTYSRNGLYSWRYRLDRELRRQGVAFDLVGSKSAPYVEPGYPGAQYLDPDFDQDHDCAQAWRLRAAIDGSLRAEVAAQQPDVLVLQLGTADVVYDSRVEAARDDLRTAIAQVREVAPHLRVVLPQLLTRDRPDPTINQRTLAYDALLPALAQELSTPESPVTVAPTARGWTPAAPYTIDGAHLSPTGEAFYAQRITEELHRVGLLPQAPSVFHGFVPWPRTVRTTMRASTGRLDVSWTRQTLSGGRLRWRQVGTSAWHTGPAMTGDHASVALPAGGTYDVQHQVIWVQLTATWGPSTRVRVPPVPRPAAPGRVVVGRKVVRWSASRGATSYVVQVRRAHRAVWTTRTTRALQVAVRGVARARVQAVGPSGRSTWRLGVR